MKTFTKFDFLYIWLCMSFGHLVMAMWYQTEQGWRDTFIVSWGAGFTLFMLWSLSGHEVNRGRQ